MIYFQTRLKIDSPYNNGIEKKMKTPINKTIDLSLFIEKAYLLVIEEGGIISLKELKDEAVLILPDQLSDFVKDKNFIEDDLAERIYMSLQERLKKPRLKMQPSSLKRKVALVTYYFAY